jgi:hypothetical protein
MRNPAFGLWAMNIAVATAFFGCSSSGSGATCNALVDDGPTVTYSAVAATALAPAGGAIADGDHQLSALTIYTGPGVHGGACDHLQCRLPDRGKFVMQQVGKQDGVEKRYTSTFTISGTTAHC